MRLGVLMLLMTIVPAAGQSVEQGLSTAPSLISSPPSGFTSINNVFTVDFAKDFGTVVTLTGLAGTATVTGLKTTDSVIVYCISTIPNGVSVANARVSAADTLEVKFATAVLGNITLGSLNYRLLVFRP